jgi:hypothetical protein
MPRVSQRQQTLRLVKNQLMLNIALQSDTEDTSGSEPDRVHMEFSDSNHSDIDYDSSDDSDVIGDMFEVEESPDDLLELYAVMDSTRYLVERGVTLKSQEFVLQFFDVMPDKQFRGMTRMDKPAFFSLVSMIESHSVFQNFAAIQQAPVQWQLAVTLDRLGHNGNASCLNHMIPTWGVSNGSLVNFTKRCFVALQYALKGFLKWPNRSERQTLSSEFAKKGFPGCVGLIDGTYIPLSQRPKEGGECYYDRKSRYSINTQIICDHNRKILFVFTGMIN